ncbi:MAG: hypothetical protein R3F61_32015 [Myxococcota bacterium]
MLVWLAGCTAPQVQDAFLYEERTFVDPSRPTEPYGELAASDSREILLLTWSDAGTDVQDRPLVLIAHGIDGNPRKFDTFASELAASGLFVAALAFPATNNESGAGYAGVADLPNQPGDLTATLEHLQAAVADPDDAFYRRFDPDTFGVIGHSLGAATVMGWTRYACCRTDQADAVVLLAVPQTLGVVFDGDPDPVGPPTVLAAGFEDGTVPWQESETFAGIIDEQALVLMEGVGHSEAIEGSEGESARARFRTLVLGFFDQELRGEAGALDRALDDPLFANDDIRR